ncbi:MAG: O-antigen ligase family protein, partial [Trebonia sp.]
LPNIRHYGVLDSVRDAALWYYGLFAILVLAASDAVPDLPRRLLRAFARFVPYLLVWLPIAVLASKAGIGAHLPLTGGVKLFDVKSGDIEVDTLVAVAFLWLVPDGRRSQRARSALSMRGLLAYALSATQNRGGALAAGLAALIALGFLAPRQKVRVVGGAVAALAVVLGLAWTSNLTIHTNKRTFSVQQLIANAQSVTGGAAAHSQLQGTIAWREQLWSTVLTKEVHSQHLVQGFGFGPNLAVIGGLPIKEATNPVLDLRNPHNSHVDVVARMGAVGALAWVVLWGAWFARMMSARRRWRLSGDRLTAGLVELCVVGEIAVLVNAFFDPSLEGAQAAVLAWVLFGLGLVCSRRSVGAAAARGGAPVGKRPVMPAVMGKAPR